MADVEMPSAVAPRDASVDPTSPHTLKRRRSADGDNRDAEKDKRQRVNGEADELPPHPQAATATPERIEAAETESNEPPLPTIKPSDTTTNGPSDAQNQPAPNSRDRRKPSMADEKQRSKRLFGSLLGNLSRPSGGDKASQRRQEIEERRKAEMRKQDEDRAQDEARRKEEVLQWRRQRQGQVGRDEMRIRHANVLERAKFLVTVTEPKVYYRPWDLRADEEGRIDEQVREAQAQVDKELEAFQARHRDSFSEIANKERKESQPPADDTMASQNHRDGDLQGPDRATDNLPAATEHGAPAKSAPAIADHEDDSKVAERKPAEVPDSDDSTDPTSYHEIVSAQKEDERMEEHIVDGDEETVIY